MDSQMLQEKLEGGQVVYYIRKYGKTWSVWFATVRDTYAGYVELQLYELPDRRRINGVPVKQFKTPTEWKPLPKDWTYDTELFQLTYDEPKPLERNYLITRPGHMQEAIQKGVIVKGQENDHAKFESEIIKRKGWRIVRKYSTGEYDVSYTRVFPDDVFATWEEATDAVNAHKAELERENSLSDYDWSVEQIDKTLARWKTRNDIPNAVERIRKIREYLLKQDRVEDIEVRAFSERVQWRYCREREWQTVLE